MQYNSLEELAKNLSPELLNAFGADDSIRKLIGQKVSKNVQSEVYGAHPNPKSYKRRGVSGGLADPESVERTSIGSDGKTIQLIFENTTEGVDNLKGEEITDIIEEGSHDAWNNPNGVWSESRPFIEPTIEELKNTGELRAQAVDVLRKAGFDVK